MEVYFQNSFPDVKNIYTNVLYTKAGCLSQHISDWKDITSDQEVLQTVQGMKLEFEESPLKKDFLKKELL